ncbi:MAG: hypothetical protein ACRCWI_07605 [Brevinema sp.]
MKYQPLLLSSIILFSNCTQNLISYVKTPYILDKISVEQALEKVGLIRSISSNDKAPIPMTNYQTGILIEDTPRLQQQFNTLQVTKNSDFQITINTKNYLIVTPYYASPGIVYQADKSAPKQGKFQFISGEQSGQIKIRIYTPQGILQSESIWYIEVI